MQSSLRDERVSVSIHASRVRVKICGMTRAQDALAAARLGADAVGLIFYPPSPRAVNVEQALAVVRDLPPLVTLVGVFVNPDNDGDSVNDAADNCVWKRSNSGTCSRERSAVNTSRKPNWVK